jgi:endoglucanase
MTGQLSGNKRKMFMQAWKINRLFICMLKPRLQIPALLVWMMMFFGLPNVTFADNGGLPTNWPWRGINVTAFDSSPDDLTRLKKALGINMVRLQVGPFWAVKGLNRDEVLRKSIAWVDAELDTCKMLGITSVINFELFPLGGDSQQKINAAFWNNKANLDEIVDVTHQLATHFHERGSELAAYDVLSEPVEVINGKAHTPAELGTLQERILHEVRVNDPQRWVVLAPGPWGGPDGYVNYNPPSGSRIIWGFHMYVPHEFTHQGIKSFKLGYEYPGRIHLKWWDKSQLRITLQPVLKFQDSHPGPVWVGEFSAVRWAKGGEQYIKDLASIFDENGWGWSYFSGTGWHGWNPDYDNLFSTDAPEDWPRHRVGFSSDRWKTLRLIFHKSLPLKY